MSGSTSQASSQTDTQKFVDFLERYYKEELSQLVQKYPREKRSLHVDYDELYRFDDQLAYSYLENPSGSREQIEDALGQTAAATSTEDELEAAHVRLSGGPSIEISNLRADDTNDLVSFSGVVAERSEPFPEVSRGVFECVRCGGITAIKQHRRKIVEPHQCQSCEKAGPFNLDLESSTVKDVQLLIVQENPEGLRGGEEPSNMTVRLEDDLTGRVLPGQKVSVSGELCLYDPSEAGDVRLEQYISCHDIAVDDETFDEMEITDSEEETIVAKSEESDIYDQMVDSVAPAIHGHEDLKEAIVLQMFSGVEKHLPDGSRIRGDIHVLAVGDPGTGKSQILQHIREIAPRAIYSQGKGSSSAGLTASCVKGDLEDEGWTVKAGTLVMADRGVAAVDELDKMDDSDRSALHQGLEQGEVTISKAGINTTLKSRCALLAAANPKYGRFDRYESIAEQIDLEPALISRFDLIFTVTDEPDAESDKRLAEHILQSNYAGELNTRTTESGHSEKIVSSDDEIVERESSNVVPEIDPELLRKYVAYSKQRCVPKIGDEARQQLKDFYVGLRAEGADDDAPVPVTARKLEALVRLAEASARVRLDDVIRPEDAGRAIRVVQRTLEDVGMDPETGELDVDTIETGTSQTQRERIKDVKALVSELQDDHDGGAPMEEILDRAEENGIERSKAEHELEKLKRQGELYEPQNNQLRTT